MVTDNYEAKVIDFGVSRFKEVDLKMTCIGTPVWMAPEVINLQKYSEKADVYSFALVIYELVKDFFKLSSHTARLREKSLTKG